VTGAGWLINICKEKEKTLKGDALKKVKISLDKLKAIAMSNGLSPLCSIANPSRAHFWTVGQSSQGIPRFTC
jgi:hypothetical protein